MIIIHGNCMKFGRGWCDYQGEGCSPLSLFVQRRKEEMIEGGKRGGRGHKLEV